LNKNYLAGAKMEISRCVLDTSIIIDGKVPDLIKERKIKEIIIPYAVLDELQAQASKGREEGFIGLDEVKKIREVCEELGVKLRFTGERPSLDDIKLAKAGRIDALIRDVAKDENATLVTADYVQALVGEAEGVKTEYIPEKIEKEELIFKKFFTPDTMSVHLKEKVPPLAKRGKPGNFTLVRIREDPCTYEELNKIIREIVDAARQMEDAFVEINKAGAMVIQLGEYRIAVAKPPFSDGLEVTIVRPIVKLKLEDYKLSEKLRERLKDPSRGVLISGPPGSGKTTFASSLADFYSSLGYVVKTLESPRDLQVGPEITQYAPLEGDFAKTADILLLVRPDYTVFDEVRKTQDFRVFADMRLAGVGLVGTVHATNPVDAIQRFITRTELGMVPHIVDTIIHIEGGEIKKVYDLSLTVKVPTGMTAEDLARPVVEIRDLETGKLEYEIYTFGEENIVVPVKEVKKVSPLKKLALERISQEIKKYDRNATIEFVSDERIVVKVDNKVIPKLIGKNGKNITNIEEKLGIHIDVEPKVPTLGKEISFSVSEAGNCISLNFGRRMKGQSVNIYINDDFLFSATIGKKGEIKVSKDSNVGKELMKALVAKKEIRATILK
jgi:ATPase